MALSSLARRIPGFHGSFRQNLLSPPETKRIIVPATGSSCLGAGKRNVCPLLPVQMIESDHARRHFHSTTSFSGSKRELVSRGRMADSMPKLDEGTEGEKLPDQGIVMQNIFPDEDLPNRLFDGIRFADLPICNIKASPNNTLISLTNAAGAVKILHSCGREGFKNTREGTNIAAQATAITLATRGVKMGYKTVRVAVKGLGPGRMSAIKGLTMGGMNVVSITDRTPVPFYPAPRPKKMRRL